MPDGVVRTDGDSRTSLSEDRQGGHIYTIYTYIYIYIYIHIYIYI